MQEKDSLFLSRKGDRREDSTRQGSATGEKVAKSEQQGRGLMPCVLRGEQELCCQQARGSIPRKGAIQNGVLFLNFCSTYASVGIKTPCICLYATQKSISCLTNILISSKQKITLLKEKDPIFCCICIPHLTLVMSSTKQGLLCVCIMGYCRPIVMMGLILHSQLQPFISSCLCLLYLSFHLLL